MPGWVWLAERGDRGECSAREDGDLRAVIPNLGDSMLGALRDGESREDIGGLGEAGICSPRSSFSPQPRLVCKIASGADAVVAVSGSCSGQGRRQVGAMVERVVVIVVSGQ